MFSLLLVMIVCVGYYYLHKYYPRDTTEQIYFVISMIVWLTIIYLMNFQELFVYNAMKQIYEVQNKPLYDISIFTNDKQDKKHEFQLMLLQNQGSRCGKCGNFILPKDIDYTHLNYKISLQEGGTNDHSNLMVVCHNCHTIFY